MFPVWNLGHIPLDGLLHVCGDVSAINGSKEAVRRSAPRMWRCFQAWLLAEGAGPVCSTYVEMFPIFILDFIRRPRLLHVCGDVS